jgi:predicted lipoprotein
MPSARRRVNPGRRWLAPRWIAVAAVVALLAAIGFSTEYRSADASARAAAAGKFNPATFGAETYEAKVVPAIESAAVELPMLLTAIAADKDAAGAKYGRRQGNSPYSFPVKGQGVAGAVKGSLLPITVAGLPPDTRVSLQVGPAINGTALRDAAGFITFGQFLNQVEYADAATALNNQMRAKVLSGLTPANLEGKKLSFTGAFTLLTPATVTITPVSLRETP